MKLMKPQFNLVGSYLCSSLTYSSKKTVPNELTSRRQSTCNITAVYQTNVISRYTVVSYYILSFVLAAQLRWSSSLFLIHSAVGCISSTLRLRFFPSHFREKIDQNSWLCVKQAMTRCIVIVKPDCFSQHFM